MKKCSKCGKYKDINDFHKNKSKSDRLSTECKECKRKQDSKYREENLEYYKEYLANYNKINKDELYDKKKIYISENKLDHLKRRHNWYEDNKEEIKARTSQYKKDHPEQYQMYNNRRAARKKTSIIEKFTHQDIIDKYGSQCIYCGGSFDKIDHYIPLSKGGSHTLDNVRPSCEHCNLTKSNKLPDEFIKYKGNKDE